MPRNIQTFTTRQVMQGKTFEIFHYHQPKAERVEVHHHDFYEIYLFLRGTVSYRVEGRIYRLEPGDLMLISPMELHQLMVEDPHTPYERIVLWIDKSYLESFSPLADLTACFDTASPNHSNLLRLTASQRSDLRLRMEELVRECYQDRYGSALCAQGVFLQLMVQLNRLAIGSGYLRSSGEESTPLVTQVLGYIAAHYHEPITLDALAARFYVSKYHLSHEFSRVVGTSVYRYITLKRLLIARQLLAEGGSPGSVCTACGFQDYTNFYRAFKTQYGISPKDCAGL